ncbi:MAG TPA: hypothetical protein VGF67_20740 [Ktedonobacteraceae bacterium]|jgi:hypothetical protein
MFLQKSGPAGIVAGLPDLIGAPAALVGSFFFSQGHLAGRHGSPTIKRVRPIVKV